MQAFIFPAFEMYVMLNLGLHVKFASADQEDRSYLLLPQLLIYIKLIGASGDQDHIEPNLIVWTAKMLLTIHV